MKKYSKEELDVDIRFLLANERTLLSWVRTSLALIAGGVVLSALHGHRIYIAISVTLAGAAMSLIGYHRYRTADRAIRSNKLPDTGIGPTLEVLMVVFVAITLSIAELTILN